MSVELKGASARAFIAGILLLSRARSFGPSGMIVPTRKTRP